jgi:uncharacterized protein (UPF0303 family)
MNELMKTLLAQEDELQFDTFKNEDALELGLLICRIAKEDIGRGVAVNIENGEHPLFTYFMEGTTSRNVFWLNAKKNTVNHFGNSSYYVGEMFRDRGTTLDESSNLPLTEYKGEGGGFPLIIRGQGKKGTIAVSGLPTGKEDHDLLVKAIRRFLSREK